MEAWKLYGLVLEVLFLMVGYSGTNMNIDSRNMILNEVLQYQDLSLEQRFSVESCFNNPDGKTLSSLMAQYPPAEGEEASEEDENAIFPSLPEIIVENEPQSISPSPGATEANETPEPSPSPGATEANETPEPSPSPGAVEASETPKPSPSPGPVQETVTPAPTLSPEQIQQQLQEAHQFRQDIQGIVDAVLQRYPLQQTFGLYIQELKTGYSFGVNEELTVFDASDGNTDGYFRAASVVKLQMAYVAYRLIEKGELEEEKTWIDAVTNKTVKILPALHKMVSESDNNLFNTMLRCIGREKVNQTLSEYGINHSHVYGEINPSIGYSRENNLFRHGTDKVGGKITPAEMGMILKAVYDEKDTSKYMGFFNEALLANIYDSRIPRGIGGKYPVAHKTGTSRDFGVYNDAGIVYCKNPYILVVLTKGETSANAQGFIRQIAKKVTEYMDSRE